VGRESVRNTRQKRSGFWLRRSFLAKADRNPNRYKALIERIFRDRFHKGATRIEFVRDELVALAAKMKIDVPKNLDDIIYSFRYRVDMPEFIRATQPEGMEWVIEGAGRAKYAFVLVKLNRIVPRDDLVTIGIPDATPEIIRAYAQDDEQALLAIVRYNRLIDTFLGLTTYSLQNHLRTTVKGVGQIEIDELYFGLDRYGCHYVIPVQAKGGKDQISVVQTKQDVAWCAQRYPGMECRAISAKFLSDDRVAMFELRIQDGAVKVAEEKHYKLVPAADLDASAIRNYTRRQKG
jgi:hypothetical protein